MSSDVQIRRVRPDEWRSWREVRLRMLRDDSDFFSSRYEDAVRDPDERWRTWVAEAADETADKVLLCADAGPEGWVGVVGGFVRVDRSEAQLISMWVSPKARGQGVAQLLVAALGAWAHRRGCKHVYLFVQEANQPARRLYGRLGFSATGDRSPIGGGRSGFKLVLGADASRLSAMTPKEDR